LLLNSHRTLQAAFGPKDKRCREAARRLAALYETWGKPEQVAKYRELAAPSTAPGSKPKP
jgi:hypothetical protein